MAGATTDFTGKVAWITGGSSGFGAEAARRLSSLGAKVVISDINRDAAAAVAEEIGGIFAPCDVTEVEDCQTAVATALEHYGQIDLAFLNAGISTGAKIDDDFDLTLYRRAMGVNLDGVVFGAHAVFATMKAAGHGDIIATASLAGLTGTGFDPVYSANKHAVIGLVRSIGDDWQQYGIRVNAICPGFADTAIVDPLRELLSDGGIPLLTVETVIDTFISVATSGRSGECWYIQPGRAGEPFTFRNIPGPRTESE